MVKEKKIQIKEQKDPNLSLSVATFGFLLWLLLFVSYLWPTSNFHIISNSFDISKLIWSSNENKGDIL